MNNFKKEFTERVEEIKKYLIFIKYIDSIETHKKEELIAGNKKIIIDRDTQKILRSNTFLLLYNLVESSIRNSIISVYDIIHDENLKYDELSNHIQEVWLTHKSKQLQNTGKNVKTWVKELIINVDTSSNILLEKDSINISGNLDYKGIEKIIKTYGFFGNLKIDKRKVENSLNLVKRERNLLAHGNKTFTTAGEIINPNELEVHMQNIVIYLSQILDNINFYISNKKYKK